MVAPMPNAPRFKAPLGQTLKELEACFRLWRMVKWDYRHTTSNAPGQSVAMVEFQKGEDRFRVSCNKYGTARENLRAVYLTVNGARLAEARGASTAKEALREYLMLSDGQPSLDHRMVESPDADNPWMILGLVQGNVDPSVVRAVYQARIRKAHPDAGGSEKDAARINGAYRQVLAELGERP